MNGLLSGKRIGFAMTGSFCSYSQVFPEAQRLADEGENGFTAEKGETFLQSVYTPVITPAP